MKIYQRENYDILLGDYPLELFDHFKTDEIHGLNRQACLKYPNSPTNAYIAGMANVWNDRPFIFINLQRCVNNKEMAALASHEMLHLSFLLLGQCLDDDTEEQWIEVFNRQLFDLLTVIEENL